ncbi:MULTISPECIES: SpoIIE family protein phosphatase [unclassified Streptomyces]|uniref:SpoIIE family protein phosphatase n=1 Tax=unclassified Streptomyces TaxID=2593676 RepID=UPI00081F2557|nr:MULTISPECIES: SpoIIE family protein phosphatase [unclassified Streptomyces]MYR26050.1 SpoIIE family protein phosphatase [Streptomyces sp. SID4945]SCE94391.1 PAS domain S-box-containing protein [Streptomyces sp. LcepLS]
MAQEEEPLFTIDGAGHVLSWSPAAGRLLGDGDGDAAGSGIALRATAGGDASPWEIRPALVDPRAPRSALERALLDALLSESQLGLVVLDRRLRVVRISAAAREMAGASSPALVGLRLDEAFPLQDPRRELAAAHRLLRTGEPVLSRLVTTLPADRVRRGHFSVSAFRLHGENGEVLGLAMTLLDVTRRERDRARELTIARVHERVGRSLRLVATCEALADALCHDFADLVVVALTEEAAGGDFAPAEPFDAARLPLRPLAVRAPAGVPPGIRAGDRVTLGDEPVLVRALHSRRPVLVRRDASGGGLSADPVRERALRAAGAHSMIVASLAVRGRLLGMLVLVRRGDADPYSHADVRTTETAALHATLCLDNARRAAHDRALASTVQRRFLDKVPNAQLGVDAAFVALSPLPQSGSWFDVLPLSGARCALVLGEIPRDSTDALVLKGQLRTALRALADLELQPDELLARLSDTVTHLAEELPGGGAPRTARCTYALYDPVARTVRVACAGHPPPLVIGPDTTVTHLDEASGPALGADDPAPFAMATRELADGSTLVLPSGDLGASLHPESLAGLLAGDATAQDLADSLFTRLAPHSDSTGTALLARTYGLGGDRTACWELPTREESAAEARRLARGWLAAHPDAIGADDLDSADLLVSELVTNAVRYGTPPLTLRLILNRSLTVEVGDSCATSPSLRHARVTDEGGRGLFIVSQLTDKWGTRRVRGGKAIWAEQPLGGG